MPSLSAGAVIFYRDTTIEYLLLRSTYWGFPKGHLEPGEDERTAALREVREEAGLEVTLLNGFREVDTWSFLRQGERVEKQAIYFLGQAQHRLVRLSREHTEMIWLPFEGALARLNYEGGRVILQKANDFLLKNDLRR